MAKRMPLVALWIVVIVYLLCIDLKGVWTDEGNRFILMSGGKTWQQFNETGSFGSFSEVLNAVGPTSYQPLFYLVDNAVVRLARSRSEVLLRLVNVLWLLLAAQGLLRFFRAYSVWTHLFAILIFSLNGYMLMHVMQIREYPMYVALMIWSACLFFEVLETPGPPPLKDWWGLLVAHGALMALLFYAHVYCIFALAAQAVLLLTRKENRAAFYRGLLLSYGVAAAMVLPWLIMIYVRFPNKVDPGVWDRRASTMRLLIDSLIDGFQHLLTYHVWGDSLLMRAFGYMVILGIPAAWFLAFRKGEPIDRRSLYALLTGLFYAAFQIYYFFKQPLAVWSRYFIGYYFGYTVLAVCAFAVVERAARKSPGPLWKVVAAGVFLLAGGAGAAQIQFYRRDPFMDTGMNEACNWRVVTRAMIPHIGPDETIAYYYPLQAWTMALHYPFYPHEVSYGDIRGPHPPTIPALWIFDTGVLPDDLKQTITRLEALNYRRTKAVDLGCDCKLFHYEKTAGAQ